MKHDRREHAGSATLIGKTALTLAVGTVALLWLQSAPEVARAQSGSTASAPAAGSRATSAPASGSEGPAGGVDEMIAHLRESFHITPAQEPLWEQVAKVMRDNSAELTRLAKTRAQDADKMSAVDDLKSYAHISEVHARGTQRLIPAFQALYDSMSAQQKQEADREFREHYHRHPQGGSQAPH